MVASTGTLYIFGTITMSTLIENTRHFCALGAQQTVVAIERAVPIIHAGPGCSYKLFLGQSLFNGLQGSSYAGGNAIPCTNTIERDVVFGGEKRLREVINGTLKVMDADIFVVLTGCTADLVGDDTAQVVRDYKERGVPIVHVETGGFKANSYRGHELVLDAIIDQFVKPTDKTIPGLVNVFASVPYQDPFWSGNLQTIRELLDGLGLTANILFGPGSGGMTSWKQIPSAQFNLVLSPWNGLRTAQRLQEKFGTPYLHYPVAPIGGAETSRFLARVGEFAGLKTDIVREYIHQQESWFYHYLDRAADFIMEFRWDMPGRFITATDSFYSLALSRFLVNDLGFIPTHQFLTDAPPEDLRSLIAKEFSDLGNDIASEITFSEDGGEIREKIKTLSLDPQPIILGSLWDKDVARDLGLASLTLATPVSDRLILDRNYLGYSGGLRLMEDIYSLLMGSFQ
jgi:nitrogenase molybdenum-iron protein beta chain